MGMIRYGTLELEEYAMSEEKKQQRKWVREEVIILVTEYFRTKHMSAEDIDASYHRVSNFLRRREAIDTGMPISDTFRNYAGIRMQSARIRCLDPDTKLSGMQGTKLQKEVVAEFLENPEAIYREAEAIYEKYNS